MGRLLVTAFLKANRGTAFELYPVWQRMDEEAKSWWSMAAKQLNDAIGEEKEERCCMAQFLIPYAPYCVL